MRLLLVLQSGLAVGVLAVYLAGAPARAADQRGPLVDDNMFWSANGHFVARPGPGDRTTVVLRLDDQGVLVKLWTMPGWNVWDSLSDDGDYLVKCREELTTRRGKSNEPVLSIYRRGELRTSIRLEQILLDERRRGPSRPGSRWGECKGFVALHLFALDTIERRRLEYDVTTGELASATIIPGDAHGGTADVGAAAQRSEEH
jgi:hypothetical protein